MIKVKQYSGCFSLSNVTFKSPYHHHPHQQRIVVEKFLFLCTPSREGIIRSLPLPALMSCLIPLLAQCATPHRKSHFQSEPQALGSIKEETEGTLLLQGFSWWSSPLQPRRAKNANYPHLSFSLFSVIKTTHPSCHQTSTSPNDLLVSRNAFSSWTLLSWFPLFQDTYAPDGLPDAGIYLNCLLLPVLALCGHRAESDTEIGSPWHAGLVSSSRPLLPGPNLLPSDPSNTASHVYHFNLTLTSETKYLPYVFWRKASSWFFFPHHLLNTAFFVFFPQGPLLATFQRCDILPL